MLRILSLDPSGTGTTGVCLINEKIGFTEFYNKNWKNHLEFIRSLASEADLVLYETTNYLHTRQHQDTVSLLKLLGAIESLPVRTEQVLVSQVKDLKNKVFKNQVLIPPLTFKFGSGWFYKSQKISLHQLDAFLVYWLWKERNG